MSFPLDS